VNDAAVRVDEILVLGIGERCLGVFVEEVSGLDWNVVVSRRGDVGVRIVLAVGLINAVAVVAVHVLVALVRGGCGRE